MEGEQLVETALTLLFELNYLPTEERVKELLVTKQTVPDVAVNMPALSIYDGLLGCSLEGASR